MKDIVKKYSNGEVVVIWKPNICIHSENCFNGLPKVFDPHRRPWIDPNAADTETIIAQIKKCPSGALSFEMEKEEKPNTTSEHKSKSDFSGTIEVTKNGPLLVRGNFVIRNGEEEKHADGNVALCRCGSSGNKPFCDGSHKKVDFKG